MKYSPMLAAIGNGPLPTGPGWAYEFKWDGVRALAHVERGRVRLYGRSGREITSAYPELQAIGDGMPSVVLDGEIVALNADGRPSFAAVAERMHVLDPTKAAVRAEANPVTFMAFDVPWLDGDDLCDYTLRYRRSRLEALDLNGGNWLTPSSFDDGYETLTVASLHQLEGVMAKRTDSPYRSGERSPDWVRVKFEATGDFVVGGWRPGARRIGGLLLGLPSPDGLRFVGRVGVGIGVEVEHRLMAALEPLQAARSPFQAVPQEDAKGALWVNPAVVVEVRYDRWTEDGRLRFPRLVRLRPDKSPADANG